MHFGTLDRLRGLYLADTEIYQSGSGSFDMVATFPEDAPAHELTGFQVGFVLDSASSVARHMHLARAYLTHVGDNFPMLQDLRDSVQVEYIM